MPDPITSDGRLSAGALREIARVAEGARRHIGGGSDNFYVGPQGAVNVPSAAPAQAADSQNVVRILDGLPQQITLTPGVNPILGFPAVLEAYVNPSTGIVDGSWTDGASPQWFVGMNGEAPVKGARYLVRQIAADVNGVPVWTARDLEAIVYITSGSPQPMTLPGGTVRAYLCTLQTFENASGIVDGTWTNAFTTDMWFWPLNGLAPSAGSRCRARLIGQDVNGVPIWSGVTTFFPPPIAVFESQNCNVPSPVAQFPALSLMATVAVPAGLYLVFAQLAATITTGPNETGVKVFVSFKYGNSLPLALGFGCDATFGTAFCPNITFTESSCKFATASLTSAVNLYLTASWVGADSTTTVSLGYDFAAVQLVNYQG